MPKQKPGRAICGLINFSRKPTRTEVEKFLAEHAQMVDDATSAMEERLGRPLLRHGESKVEADVRRAKWKERKKFTDCGP
ncbi:MAG: hypothetical protein AAB729_00790 [Patescibacteria group bacterium]